jgi:glycosyltransferase involved in cell wall biosynthesis
MEYEIDVSVVLLSYNQELFIQQSLDSILCQKFKGTWEIIIGDDCSSDSTFQIIQSVKSPHSNLIRSYSNDLNLGLARNFEKGISQANGKYIAYLEGDDYWTDPLKLQKQYDFLETNPNYVLAFHDFITVDKFGTILSDKNLNNSALKRHRSKKDMVTGCLIHQNTMMFRNIISKFPKGFFLVRNHDTFFIAYLSHWGEAGYVICEPLHYRIHSKSLWSNLAEKRKHMNGLITFSILLAYIPFRFYGFVIRKIFSKFKFYLKSQEFFGPYRNLD